MASIRRFECWTNPLNGDNGSNMYVVQAVVFKIYLLEKNYESVMKGYSLLEDTLFYFLILFKSVMKVQGSRTQSKMWTVDSRRLHVAESVWGRTCSCLRFYH